VNRGVDTQNGRCPLSARRSRVLAFKAASRFNPICEFSTASAVAGAPRAADGMRSYRVANSNCSLRGKIFALPAPAAGPIGLAAGYILLAARFLLFCADKVLRLILAA
jgi:hypothetical protein